MPRPDEIALSPTPAYVHLTSNETIQGIQWHAFPDVGDRPLVADMSSDILSRPFDAGRFALIYAGAQKNLGPAGVTAVLLRESWLAKANKNVPTMLRYAHARQEQLALQHAADASASTCWTWCCNGSRRPAACRRWRSATPARPELVYDAIDQSGGFYRGHAEPESRSLMNVTFRLPSEALEKQFVAEAQAAGMVGLAGHRSVGGIRASTVQRRQPGGVPGAGVVHGRLRPGRTHRRLQA